MHRDIDSVYSYTLDEADDQQEDCQSPRLIRHDVHTVLKFVRKFFMLLERK